ncbi:MAG: DMT family transporter [Bryobacteraceae bacterium]
MRSWIFLFLCNLMWALQFTCVKLVQDQVGPLFTVWGPMTLATLLLIPLIRAESGSSGIRLKRRSDALLFLVLAAIGVFPGQVIVTWGTRMTTASNAAIIMLALPVCTAVLAFFFLRERMTAIRWVSFGIAIAGVLLCSESDLRGMHFQTTYLAGNALVAFGMLGSSFYNSYGKKVLERYAPMEMLFYTYVGMFVILTPFVLVEEGGVFSRVPSFTASTWLGLILLTALHNYLSMVLFLKALHKLDAIQAALSNYLITFFGIPVAAIVLGERMSSAAIIGGILVLASTLLISIRGAAQGNVCEPS